MFQRGWNHQPEMFSVFFCYMLIMVKKYGNVWYMMKYEPFLFHIISKTIHKTKNWDVGQDIRTWCNPGLINCVWWLVGYGLPSRQCHLFSWEKYEIVPSYESKLAVFFKFRVNMCFFAQESTHKFGNRVNKGSDHLRSGFQPFYLFGCHVSQFLDVANTTKVSKIKAAMLPRSRPVCFHCVLLEKNNTLW